jgi:hypothetical protein
MLLFDQDTLYSNDPNTGPVQFSNARFVSGCRMQMVLYCMIPTSLDRFILKSVTKRTFFCVKRSRLELKKLPVRFVKAFYPFKNQSQKVSEK